MGFVWSIIITVVLAGLIAFYAGWVIYKSIKRAREGKGCCGCDGCEKKCEYKK